MKLSNIAMACAAVLMMGGMSAQAATQSASTSNVQAVCATADGVQDPICQKANLNSEESLARWGRGGWHRGGWGRGGWGRGPVRGWCYWHPYAPRCR